METTQDPEVKLKLIKRNIMDAFIDLDILLNQMSDKKRASKMAFEAYQAVMQHLLVSMHHYHTTNPESFEALVKEIGGGMALEMATRDSENLQ